MLFWFYFPLFSSSSSSYHYVSALDIQQNGISEMDSGIKYIEFEKIKLTFGLQKKFWRLNQLSPAYKYLILGWPMN